MGIKPEEVLEKYRVSSLGRIEKAYVKSPLRYQQKKCDSHNRRCEQLQYCGCVGSPYEKRQPSPGHSGCPELVYCHYEIHSGENRRESEHEDPQSYQYYLGTRLNAVGSVKCPARIGRLQKRGKQYCRSDKIYPETQQVDSGKCHVPGPDHKRYQKIAEARRYPRNDKKENHEGAMKSERYVVLRRSSEKVKLWSHKLVSHSKSR